MIDTPQALAALVQQIRQRPRVALDTEFVWERTYYPRLGLVQIGLSRDEVYLVDTVALPDLSPLRPLLEDPGVVKLLHDAQQDLTILRRASGASPVRIFDTQLAAGFVGLSATISLQDLVAETTGVRLTKGETRSDWLQRPLSERQTAYALDDVRYLPEAYEALTQRLAARGREAWAGEEMAAYDDPALYEPDDARERYGQVKGRSKRGFSPLDYAVLRELAAWREDEARERDRPRGHIVPDDALIEVAQRRPRTEADLRNVRALSEAARRRHGDALLRAVEAGLAVPAADRPHQPPARKPFDETVAARVDLALALVKGRCLRDEVDPGLVATRAEVERLVAAGPSDRSPLLQGWRRKLVGEDLLRLLRGEAAVGIDGGVPALVAAKPTEAL